MQNGLNTGRVVQRKCLRTQKWHLGAGPPSYEEKHFPVASKQGQLRLVASNDGREGSVLIHQNAAIYATIMAAGDKLTHELASGRVAYVHVIRGDVTVNGTALRGGDALKITSENLVTLDQATDAEVLVFDLPY